MKDLENTQPDKKKIPGQKPTIALLGDVLYFDIPLKIFKIARKLAEKYNFNLLYIAGEVFHPTFEFNNQANMLYNMVSSQTADGLLTLTNLLSAFSSPQVFRKRCFQFQPLPIVSLGAPLKDIHSVILKNEKGMFDAVCHLIEKHHYTKIAFLSGPPENQDIIERRAGFTSAMKKHGLPIDESLLLNGNYQRQTGISAVKELIDVRGKIPGKDVEAIVCCNDYMASGVMLELQDRNIRIPEDIALIGFDDVAFSEYLFPSLSTVKQPYEIMVTTAIEILLNLMNGKPAPDVIQVEAPFITRRSCGCRDTSAYEIIPCREPEKEESFNPTSYKFLEQLNRKVIIADQQTLDYWQDSLFYLYRRSLEHEQPKTETDFKTFDKNLWNILSKSVDKTFSRFNYVNVMHDIGITLTSTQELPELLNIFTEMLPAAGIERYCICLYENPEASPNALPPWSRLVMAFNQPKALKIPPGGIRFPTARLLPEELIEKQEWKNWVIIALYFDKEQIGYALTDLDAHYEKIYWNLSKQISGALRGARLLNESREAYRLLKEANEQKTQFFINVAHETKTPLTLIRNYMELYLEQHPPDENLTVIKQNIDSLLENMLNILNVEKLKKGDEIYKHNTLVNLSESARKKCMIFRRAARMKKINITVKAQADIFIRIDPWALDRIFNNLLDNAVKYTQQGGEISVNIQNDDAAAVLNISDNGPGLPMETYEHIFEPYYLLSRKRERHQGIGVGLSIVKRIVDGAGAIITVEQPETGGTSFTLTFPRTCLHEGDEEILEIPGTEPLPLVRGNIKEKNITTNKHSLLIVDDNIQLLKFMQKSLEKKYNVFLARDVQEAHFKLKTMPRPELIISDIMMDGPDGFTLLTDLGTMEGYNDIPFIFLTAMSSEKKKVAGLDLGAVDYIEKPFSIGELKAKIHSIITLRKRQEQQEIDNMHSRIEELFSGFREKSTFSIKPGFDVLCEKYGINGRETEIIRMLLGGLLHKEIALRLSLSLRAVEYHISKIYKKCGVKNKYDLLNKFQS